MLLRRLVFSCLAALAAFPTFANEKPVRCNELIAAGADASRLEITVTSTESCPAGACRIDWTPYRNGSVHVRYRIEDEAIRADTGTTALTLTLAVSDEATFRRATQAAFDPDEQIYRLATALKADVQRTGRKTVAATRFDVDAATGRFVLARGAAVSPVEPQTATRVFGSRIDLAPLVKAQASLQAAPRVIGTTPAAHVLFLASAVPGEPFLPGEVTTLMNFYADLLRQEQPYLERQGYDFSDGLPDVPDVVQAIKLSPDPARPGEFLVFEMSAHTAKATGTDGTAWVRLSPPRF